MRKLEIDWQPEYYDGFELEDKPGASSRSMEQPGVGIELLWNVPSQWWKPLLVVHLYRTVIQVGWHFGDAD